MNLKVIAIIQARMGSKRLPGKCMADLAGKPLLHQVLERIKRCNMLDEIVLATTNKTEDDKLIRIAQNCRVATFRGAENDLVDRYYQAAIEFKADIIVRICADNPVLEPQEIDRIIEYHKKGENDFSTNTHNINGNGYPDGLGAEVFSFDILKELWKVTETPHNREHPHTYIYEHPEKYKLGTVYCPEHFKRPDLVLDVNTPEELELLQSIYKYWYPKKPDFHITDIIWWWDNVRVEGKPRS